MNARTRNWLIRGSVIAALAVVILLGWLNRSRVPVQRGQAAPDFRAPMLGGGTVTLSSLKGRVVLVNIWATWCGPCRWEMPAMQRLYSRLAPRGLAILAVSQDEPAAPGAAYGGTQGDVVPFVARNGITFTVLLDPHGDIEDLYGVTGLPTTFILNKRGEIVGKVLGPAEWDRPPRSTEIERLLEE